MKHWKVYLVCVSVCVCSAWGRWASWWANAGHTTQAPAWPPSGWRKLWPKCPSHRTLNCEGGSDRSNRLREKRWGQRQPSRSSPLQAERQAPSGPILLSVKAPSQQHTGQSAPPAGEHQRGRLLPCRHPGQRGAGSTGHHTITYNLLFNVTPFCNGPVGFYKCYIILFNAPVSFSVKGKMCFNENGWKKSKCRK